MNRRRFTFLFILLMMIWGCSLMMREPRVDLTRISIVSMDTAGADIECALAISNPNSFDLTLRGYSYDLQVMSLPLAAGGLQQPLAIPAGKRTDMVLPIRVRYGDLLRIMKRHPDFDRLPYRIQASLMLTTTLGEITVPVDRSGSFSVPERYRPAHLLNRLLGIVSLPR